MINHIERYFNNLIPVEDEDLFYHFEPSYKIKNENLEISISFFLKFSYAKKNIIYYKITDQGEVSGICRLCGSCNCQHIHALIYKVWNDHQDEIKQTLNELSVMVEKEKQQKRKNEFHKNLLNLSSLIDQHEYFESLKKIQLKPILDIHENCIYLKIGRRDEKMYTIQNIPTFLNRFKNNETYSYGKELSFMHNEEIFEESSKKIIFFLQSLFVDQVFYKSKNAFLKSDDTMCQFIRAGKNSFVEIDYNTYYISLLEINPKIFIQKDYTLKIMLSEDEEIFYDMIKNNQSNTINLISLDENYKKLILNINAYNGYSIKEIVDDFKATIYLKYANLIQVDESIMNEFMQNCFKIHVFFDFENQKILYQEKLFFNNQDVLKEQLNHFSLKIYQKFKRILANYGFEFNELIDENNVINFINADLSDLKQVADVYLSESLKRLKIEGFTPPTVKAYYENNTLSVFLPESDYNQEELKEIIKAVKKKKKYVLLKNDRIVTLNNDASNFQQIVEDLNLNEDELFETQQVSVYNLFKPTAYQYNLTVDDYLSKMLSDIAHFKDKAIMLPELNATLRPYQKEGFYWLKTLTQYQLGGILADDMGLGKTLEIIALLASCDEQTPSLIVCPKSLIFNWLNEFARFAPNLNVQAVYGSAALRKSMILNIKEDVQCIYITSYDSLRLDIEFYKKISFQFAILDEAQYIKNIFAKKTKSVKSINAQHRFVLTGTPIENNIFDLWSIFDFIMPKYLPGISEFGSKFEHDENYRPILIKKISPFILRRTKKEVLTDLPEKYEVVMTCDMVEEQRKLYDAYRLDAKEKMDRGEITKFGVLTFLTRLRQVCVDPSMFVENYNFGSGKINALYSIINERLISKHRILIFSQFVKCLEIVEKNLKMNHIEYRIITGDTPAQQRLEICDDFNQDDTIKIVLISLKAGGTGLNLTGADVVIHVDPWWNLSAQNQATDRAHRIGQIKNVEVIKLICENSIEQKVVELQNLKKDLIDEMITNDDSSITNLSDDDMNFILS